MVDIWDKSAAGLADYGFITVGKGGGISPAPLFPRAGRKAKVEYYRKRVGLLLFV
jgi:hypothetical protein